MAAGWLAKRFACSEPEVPKKVAGSAISASIASYWLDLWHRQALGTKTTSTALRAPGCATSVWETTPGAGSGWSLSS
jgi:hypothetical protein